MQRMALFYRVPVFVALAFVSLGAWDPVSAGAYPAEHVLKAVLFDSTEPKNSVGMIAHQFLEIGDDYENHEVLGFEPGRILLKNRATFEVIRIPAEDFMRSKDCVEIRHRFVVKQLHAIYDAQAAYIAKYGDRYAPDLETLIKEELLPGGFSEGIKQDYFFSVLEIKAEFNKEPQFFVRASPVSSIQPDSFFSVDELGEIHFSDTKVLLPVGPVWDYFDHGAPRSEDLGVN